MTTMYIFHTEADILKKWKQLRDTYWSNRQKYQENKPRSGDSSDDLYKPKWKFYEAMQFLDTFTKTRSLSSSLPSQVEVRSHSPSPQPKQNNPSSSNQTFVNSDEISMFFFTNV